MKRLRDNHRVALKVPNLVNDYPESLMLVAHNGRSLHAHIIEVRADINFKEADLILHSETRATSSDKNNFYDLDGFNLVRADALAQDGDIVRPHHGTAIHYRGQIGCEGTQVHSRRGQDIFEGTFNLHIRDLPTLVVLSIYRSEKFSSFDSFCGELLPILNRLQNVPSVLAGDFNIDMLHDSPPVSRLLKMMLRFGFRQHVTIHTHKYGALLDHVWTNLDIERFDISTGVCISYWSDHSPVWCKIKPRATN
jgi:exonuclease III